MDALPQGALTYGASLLSGFVPVLLFLAGLRLLDSFKLVSRADVVRSIAAGVCAAGVAWAINDTAVHGAGVNGLVLRRYVAPLFEEALKAAVVVVLVRSRRIGFLVDGAIHGFAIGAGFALAENLFYALTLPTFQPAVWVVRGLGTAILHGSTTAIVGMVTRLVVERRAWPAWRAAVPGWAIAVVAHSAWNHLFLNPFLTAGLQLVVMPMVMMFVFERSERATRDWLGTGFDGDVERLEQVLEGEVGETPIGRYLETLRERFDGPVRADMLCLVRIRLELACRAKGLLIARAAGVELPPDPAITASLREMRHLERTLGPVARLAVEPLLANTDRDRWQIGLLEG
jgi:RsiW-degrading membrane proteinase PrsW (M82 family)